MKGLAILETGFEDVEAIAVIDLLHRAGIKIDTSSIQNNEVITRSNQRFITEITLDTINDLDNYDFLFLPGGPAVFNILNENSMIMKAIKAFRKEEKYIFAICAAPRLLGQAGILDGVNYTCFPGCEPSTGNKQETSVCKDGKIITARSMYYSIDLGLAIIEELLGTFHKDKILKEIKGIK